MRQFGGGSAAKRRANQSCQLLASAQSGHADLGGLNSAKRTEQSFVILYLKSGLEPEII